MPDGERAVIRVPRDESGRRALLVSRPIGWEYLYFGACLYAGIERTEDKWRDFSFGYSMVVGPKADVHEFVNREFPNRVQAIVRRFNLIIADTPQELAFGEPGIAGRPALISHMARRFTESYEQLLDLLDEAYSLRLSGPTDDLEKARQAFVAMCTPAIAECRRFVSDCIPQFEQLSTALTNQQPGTPVNMALTMTMPIEAVDAFAMHIEGAYRAA